MAALTSELFGLAAKVFTGVFDPYFVVKPYSKYQFVANACGLMTAFNVAVVAVRRLAAVVTTEGAADVLRTPSDPYVEPTLFVATIRYR